VGFRYVAREPLRPYQNKGLHTLIGHWIVADTSPRWDLRHAAL